MKLLAKASQDSFLDFCAGPLPETTHKWNKKTSNNPGHPLIYYLLCEHCGLEIFADGFKGSYKWEAYIDGSDYGTKLDSIPLTCSEFNMHNAIS